MTRLVVSLAILSLPVWPQLQSNELKHVMTTTPGGLKLQMVALNVDKDWASSIVHLKGDVRVHIYPAEQHPKSATTIHADAVDVNEIAGEVSPVGNVRVSVEPLNQN